MNNNILSTIIRNLEKNLSGTALAIIGLSIGLASFMIILSYVNYEFSFDKHYSDYENTYRFTTDLIWENGDRQVAAVSPTPSAKHLVKDFPEITKASCFFMAPKTLLSLNNGAGKNNFFEEYLLFTDENFADLFDVKLNSNNAEEILKQPNTLIISESTAKKLFGQTDPLEKIIEMEGSGKWTIKGIMKDHPASSHIRFNMLASIVGQEQFDTDVWRTMNAYTYFKTLPGTDATNLEAKFESLIDNYMPIYKNMLEFRLQPLSNVHLKNDRAFDYAITSNIKNIYILLSISILILIIASFNYSNLLLAKNNEHQKEMGVKKILGAAKSTIFVQLLSKGIFISLVSVLFGVLITEITIPALNKIFSYHIEVSFLNYLFYAAIILFITGVLSVTFPAMSVAKINPINVMNNFKGNSANRSKQVPQKLSLIVQFALTIALITGAIFTFKQLMFLKNKDLGFNTENVMVLDIGNDETYTIPKLLKEELLNHPGVLEVGLANSTPGQETSSEHFIPEGFENHLPLNIFNVDADFVPALNLQLVAGRNFNPEFKQDTAACLINESTLKKLGWNRDEAIGKTMKWNFAQTRENQINGKVIGVVKDFHFRSLHQPIEELVITTHTNQTPVMLIKLLPEQTLNSVKYIERKFAEINPDVPFEYSFLKAGIKQLYSKDDELRMLTTGFSLIAILISCLGLYSYSTSICTKRVKEIGVRKVNGATITEVLSMLNVDFIKWVGISFIIACPLSWFAMNSWLENFAYKTNLSWWIFALAGVLALGIALLTVSWQSWKAATRNPVEALRYE